MPLALRPDPCTPEEALLSLPASSPLCVCVKTGDEHSSPGHMQPAPRHGTSFGFLAPLELAPVATASG